jgi:hypothetical protein
MVSVTIKRESSTVLKNLKNMKSGSVKIGWFPSARYDDEKSTPVAAVAAQNEYGNPNNNIPARPFLRPAIARDEKKWADIGKRGLKAVLAGKSTNQAVLDLIGVTAVGDIQHSIALVFSPPLAPATIAARIARRSYTGALNATQSKTIAKPLIDTGHMQATVSYEINGGI